MIQQLAQKNGSEESKVHKEKLEALALNAAAPITN